jgi:hypothetical protein
MGCQSRYSLSIPPPISQNVNTTVVHLPRVQVASIAFGGQIQTVRSPPKTLPLPTQPSDDEKAANRRGKKKQELLRNDHICSEPFRLVLACSKMYMISFVFKPSFYQRERKRKIVGRCGNWTHDLSHVYICEATEDGVSVLIAACGSDSGSLQIIPPKELLVGKRGNWWMVITY